MKIKQTVNGKIEEIEIPTKNKIIIYPKHRKNTKQRISGLSYSCDICGTILCKDNETLPSIRCSMYLSDEIYEHFCDVHTKEIDDFINKLKNDYHANRL